MLAPSARTMSPFLQERIVLRPMKTPLPIVMPRVGLALGVEQAVIVDDDVVADADLVRVPQHDTLTEDHVSPTGAEEQRYRRLRSTRPSAPGTHCDSSCTSSYSRSAPTRVARR